MFTNEINLNSVAEIKKEFTLFSLQQRKMRGQLQIVQLGLYNNDGQAELLVDDDNLVKVKYKVMMYFIHLIDLNGLRRDKNYENYDKNILVIFVVKG